jgi:pSer/pThr/pTyr-binding forkhead associated (FHA) protein
MYRLIFLNGRNKGRRVAVQQGTLVIGRDPGCQIDLADDDQVSREHARLEQRPSGIWIKDLGALNKPVVNGRPVDEIRLNHGDQIEIGHTQLEFQVIEESRVGSRRRTGKVQLITYAAIGLVLLMEAVFVFLFPLWQGGDIPDAAEPRPPAATSSVATVEQDLEAARARLAAATQDVASATSATPAAVAAEVEELRAAVAGLREQLKGLADESGTGTAAAVAAAMPPAAAVDVAKPVETAAVSAAKAPVATSTVVQVAQPPPPAATQVLAEAEAESVEPSPLIDVPRPEDERPPEEDPLTARARELLALALEEVTRGNHIAADQLLDRLQVMAPDFVPGFVERARLYEKRGILAKAGEQWAEVMKRTAGTPLYNEAAAERQRVARAEAILATARQGAPERTTGSRLPRRVRIVSVDRERFQGNKEFDEMRLVRVNLKPRLSEGALDGTDLAVWVTFYDRVVGANKVVPTGATVPEEVLQIDGAWAPGEQKTVTATYILPKGFRQDELDTTGERRVYEGYRVQIFYKEELQDEDALPRNLLDLAPRPLPESAADRLNRPIPLR